MDIAKTNFAGFLIGALLFLWFCWPAVFKGMLNVLQYPLSGDPQACSAAMAEKADVFCFLGIWYIDSGGGFARGSSLVLNYAGSF